MDFRRLCHNGITCNFYDWNGVEHMNEKFKKLMNLDEMSKKAVLARFFGHAETQLKYGKDIEPKTFFQMIDEQVKEAEKDERFG